MIGFPTANGTMVAVIATYSILVVVNMVSSEEISLDKKSSKDKLESRNKYMDKVSTLLDNINKWNNIIL